jgi:hypothetical protein
MGTAVPWNTMPPLRLEECQGGRANTQVRNALHVNANAAKCTGDPTYLETNVRTSLGNVCNCIADSFEHGVVRMHAFFLGDLDMVGCVK